jgi:hypothetical protein
MGKETQLKRARRLIEVEGDSVIYRGEQWLYLRDNHEYVVRAAALLEKAGKLVRWSEKHPTVVRLLG